MMRHALFHVSTLIIWFHTIHQSLHIQCLELSLIFEECVVVLMIKRLATRSFLGLGYMIDQHWTDIYVLRVSGHKAIPNAIAISCVVKGYLAPTII
jgi:hypothetical protein